MTEAPPKPPGLETPRVLSQNGIELPENCLIGGELDMHYMRVMIGLRHDHPQSTLFVNNVETVKIIAILCDEWSVIGEEAVGIYSVGGYVKATEDSVPLLPKTVGYGDNSFTDVLLPGLGQRGAPRIWFRPKKPLEVNELHDHVPELKGCRDIHKNIYKEIGDATGEEAWNVSYEKNEDSTIYCPLGYMIRAWYTKVKPEDRDAPIPRTVRCPDGNYRMGYVVSRVFAENYLDNMAKWLEDPRLEVSLTTFAIGGAVTRGTDWKVFARLHVFYSNRT